MVGFAVGVATFGDAIRTAREIIGWTQRELADAAQLSESLIRRTEASVKCEIKRSSAVQLMQALAKGAHSAARVIPRELWEDIATMANLPSVVLAPSQREAMTQLRRESAAFDGMAPDVRRCYLMLGDLIEQRGAAAVLKLLEVATVFSEDSTPSEPRRVRVVSPPVQKSGYVEQVVTEYEAPADDAASKPAAQRKARRAGG